ncbi:MAG: Phosphoenolpyruvate synthase [Myxococcales bacterium]|nr:Phosphoenolpyruvate synthase [Myxococcales bacterium]
MTSFRSRWRPFAGGERLGCYVLGFHEIDRTQIAVVGGKGAHLGELSRIEGIRVPAGLCVTTDAFQRITVEAPSIDDRLERLSRLKPDDREAIRALSVEIRRTLEGIAIPDDLAAAITRPLARLGEQAAYAIRSSATAEDLPTASFAGQHDTYLNVVGATAILEHISRCWASLFTERAVTYRLRNEAAIVRCSCVDAITAADRSRSVPEPRGTTPGPNRSAI